MEEKKTQVETTENVSKVKLPTSINMDKVKAFFAPVLLFFKDKNNSGKVALVLAALSVA
jgi:hypothetical protein